MRRGGIIAAAAAAACALALASCGGEGYDSSASPSRVDGQASSLVKDFIAAVEAKDRNRLDDLLDPAWQIQRGAGEGIGKAEYLDNLPDVSDFSVSNVQGTRYGNVIVASYVLQISLVVDGKPFTGKPVPGLATFVEAGGSWRMTSQANFAKPK